MPDPQTPQKSPTTPSTYDDIDLNLIGTVCPMGFVKTRVLLDKKNSGDTIVLLYEDTAANEPLVRSIETLGHKIIAQTSIQIAAQNTEMEKTKAFKLSIQVKK